MVRVERKFPLAFRGAGPPLANLILPADIICSETNHRKYDQLKTYTVKVDLDSQSAPASYEVYAIQDTWMLKQAVALAHAVYNDNTKEERAMMEKKMLAKWGGFRLDHGLSAVATSGAAAFYNPLSGLTGVVNTAEIYLSEVSAAAGQATFKLTGATTPTEFNIIEQLDLSSNSIPSPSTVNTTIPYDGIEVDVSTSSATYEHIQQDGNLPPYDRNNLETNIWVHVGTLHINANGNQKLSTGYFNAPLGMVYLEGYSGQDSAPNTKALTLEFKKGDYQGVHAIDICSASDIRTWEGRLNG